MRYAFYANRLAGQQVLPVLVQPCVPDVPAPVRDGNNLDTRVGRRGRDGHRRHKIHKREGPGDATVPIPLKGGRIGASQGYPSLL